MFSTVRSRILYRFCNKISLWSQIQSHRTYSAISSPNDFTVWVESGDKPKGLCRGIIGIKLIGDGIVGDEDELSVAEFPSRFKRGHKHTFHIDEPKIKNVDGIEIYGDPMVGKGGWKIDKVGITNNETGVEKVFPVFTNIRNGRTYKFMMNDLSLPQLSSREKDRQSDLVEMRELYELTDERLPGCPPLIKTMPPEEEFSFSRTFDIGFKLTALSIDATIQKVFSGVFSGEFKTIDDIQSVFGLVFPAPSNLNRWRDDVLFGMQRLMSLNPAVIRLCTEIPEKLPVNSNMVEPFLENMTLNEALQKKKIFIIDYEILEGIPTIPEYVMSAPIALFFQRADGRIVPIAIQLSQKPSTKNNPVFLPSDPENLWILAKMWFNVADSNYHQSVAHLGFTHLKMEGIAVCTHRQIHKNHPVFKLLMPHFLYLIAINYIGIPLLLDDDGYITKLLSLGKEGTAELIKRKNKTWRMDVEGTLPNDLKARGVDDPNTLPYYFYRSDAKEVYEAILSYVKKYLDLYYTSDEDIQNDYEIQKWRQELVASVEEGGLGILGVYGEKGHFTTKEQVCLTLTSIIFTCSVQHAAVNFRQYEDYAYLPNCPLSLRGSPPKNKEEIEDLQLLQSLPGKASLYDTLVITSVLSENSTHRLGNFEVQYITDERALKVVEEFRTNLERICKNIKDKNNEQRPLEKYWCLSPYRIPNSISI